MRSSEVIELTTDTLLSLKEASEWASNHIGKHVTPSNISYLIQYGRIRRFSANGYSAVSLHDLIEYYQSYIGHREIIFQRTSWK